MVVVSRALKLMGHIIPDIMLSLCNMAKTSEYRFAVSIFYFVGVDFVVSVRDGCNVETLPSY